MKTETKDRLIAENKATLQGVTELRQLKLIKEETFIEVKEAIELAISEIEYAHKFQYDGIYKKEQEAKTVHFKDGASIDVPDGITWEYENDQNWLKTVQRG